MGFNHNTLHEYAAFPVSLLISGFVEFSWHMSGGDSFDCFDESAIQGMGCNLNLLETRC